MRLTSIRQIMRAILIALIFASAGSLILIYQFVPTEVVKLELGDVVPKDIVAPRQVVYTSTIGMIYVAGAMFGMLIYGETFPFFQNFAESGYLGERTLSDWLGLRPGAVAFLVILMALGMFYGAELLEKKFGGKSATREDKNGGITISEKKLAMEQSL